MFSKSLGRAARSSTTLQSCSCQAARLPQATTGITAKSTPNSRRYSSSKAPCPPGDGRGSSEPAAENAASTSSTSRGPTEEPKRSSGRATRRKSRDTSEVAVKTSNEQFANLPSVPPLNLPVPDWNLSRFFAQDRPLSITHPIPPSTTASAFASLFTPRTSKQKSEDVIYTLSSAVTRFDSASHSQSGEEKDLRWELVQAQAGEAGNFQHHGHMSLEQLTRQFRPFSVPPVPVPFDEAIEGAASKRQQRLREREQVMEGKGVRRKTYKTTLTISEATAADGQPTYTFSASPIIEHDVNVARQRGGIRVVSPAMPAKRLNPSTLTVVPLKAKVLPTSTTGITVTKHNAAAKADAEMKVSGIRKRTVRAMGMRVGAEMTEPEKQERKKQILVISVKRRRQLKMKKHKYKKLMKRTRNLRRREGRN